MRSRRSAESAESVRRSSMAAPAASGLPSAAAPRRRRSAGRSTGGGAAGAGSPTGRSTGSRSARPCSAAAARDLSAAGFATRPTRRHIRGAAGGASAPSPSRRCRRPRARRPRGRCGASGPRRSSRAGRPTGTGRCLRPGRRGARARHFGGDLVQPGGSPAADVAGLGDDHRPAVALPGLREQGGERLPARIAYVPVQRRCSVADFPLAAVVVVDADQVECRRLAAERRVRRGRRAGPRPATGARTPCRPAAAVRGGRAARRRGRPARRGGSGRAGRRAHRFDAGQRRARRAGA